MGERGRRKEGPKRKSGVLVLYAKKKGGGQRKMNLNGIRIDTCMIQWIG